MAIGFVYLLGNRSMPGIYKIGCTERSPSRRAEELSSSTGVPTPFDVVCYWEGDGFQAYERELHKVYADSRVSEFREFFNYELLHELVEDIERRWMLECRSFCITTIGHSYLEEDSKRGPR